LLFISLSSLAAHGTPSTLRSFYSISSLRADDSQALDGLLRELQGYQERLGGTSLPASSGGTRTNTSATAVSSTLGDALAAGAFGVRGVAAEDLGGEERWGAARGGGEVVGDAREVVDTPSSSVSWSQTLRSLGMAE